MPVIYTPPGTPEWLRVEINSAERTIYHQYILFGRLAEDTENAVSTLPDRLIGAMASDRLPPQVSAVLANLRQQEYALSIVDAKIKDLTGTWVENVSRWGARQIVGVVTELNRQFHAITDLVSPHEQQGHNHAEAPGGASQLALLAHKAEQKMLADLDDALAAVTRIVQQARDTATEQSGQVHEHAQRIDPGTPPAPVRPPAHAPVAHPPVSDSPSTPSSVEPEAPVASSPMPTASPDATTSPIPTDSPSP